MTSTLTKPIMIGLSVLAVVLSLVLAWSLYSQIGLTESKGAAELNAQAWETKHNQAIAAQKETAEQLEKMKADKAQVDKQLLDWKQKTENVESRLASANRRLRTLERENEELSAFLRSPVPLELWCMFFPDSPRCTGRDGGGAQDRKSVSTTNLDTGQKASTGARK